MQKGKPDKLGVVVVPPLKKGHYFVTFCEEFWERENAIMGRIEIYQPGETYPSLPELRFHFRDEPGAKAAWELFREYYDFVNLTERELGIMKENLKLFQQEET
jgi:hypothetical protein